MTRGQLIRETAMTFACPKCCQLAWEPCVVVQRRPYRNGRPVKSGGGQATEMHSARWLLGKQQVEQDEITPPPQGGSDE